jgi:hypothetical protein
LIYEGQRFETFGAKRWLSAEDFLRYVGLRDGRCAPPELRPLEPNEAYLRFKDCYGIELSRQQERAAQVVDGATLLVAVPGSGKTTVLVARLGYLGTFARTTRSASAGSRFSPGLATSVSPWYATTHDRYDSHHMHPQQAKSAPRTIWGTLSGPSWISHKNSRSTCG